MLMWLMRFLIGCADPRAAGLYLLIDGPSSTTALDISLVSFNHIPGGSNVLYMDGHTEFMKYPGKFPMVAIWVYRP